MHMILFPIVLVECCFTLHIVVFSVVADSHINKYIIFITVMLL